MQVFLIVMADQTFRTTLTMVENKDGLNAS